MYSTGKWLIMTALGGGVVSYSTEHWVLFGVCVGLLGASLIFAGVTIFVRRKKRQQPTPDQSPAAPQLLAADYYKTFDNWVLTNAEARIREEAAKYVVGVERENHIIRAYASTIYMAYFELAYAGSFGSQLRVVRELADKPLGLPVPDLQRFYDEGVAQLPIAYARRSFSDWFGFLTSCELIAQEGAIVKIAPYGKELLKYMVDRSYSINDRLG
jgi:hypothetical protein